MRPDSLQVTPQPPLFMLQDHFGFQVTVLPFTVIVPSPFQVPSRTSRRFAAGGTSRNRAAPAGAAEATNARSRETAAGATFMPTPLCTGRDNRQPPETAWR